MTSITALLEELARTELGPQGLAGVRAIASEHHVGNDPVAKAAALAAAMMQTRGRSARETYAWIAEALVPQVIKSFPVLVRANRTTMSVLMHVNQVGPATLDALLPGVAAPVVDIELVDVESVRLRFAGTELVAGLMEGVALGCGRHFGERVQCTWVSAPEPGATARCILEVSVRALNATPRSPTPAEGQPERRSTKR